MRDFIIWLGCILLIISGMIFGICIDSNSVTLDSIYKVFGSISSIATIVMVSIAAFALTTWKDQFYHTKQYDHLTELESIARNAISHLEAYITSNKELKLDSNPNCLVDTEYYESLKKSSSSNFLTEIEKYRIKIDHIFPLLTESQVKNFKYTYSNFRKITHDLRTRVYLLYVINDYEQSEYNLIESDILKLKLDIQKCFQSYWRR